MTEISAVFFDLGGVLLSDAWDRAQRSLAAVKFELDRDDFEARHQKIVAALETGQADLKEYLGYTVFHRARPFSIDEFRGFMFSQSKALPESMEIMTLLSHAHRHLLAVINNESLELNNFRIEKFGLKDHFTAFFSSCFVGFRKPDKEIYQRALWITQRRPEECLFIDDREVNLETARLLGMNTIHFAGVEKLKDDLARLGVRGTAAGKAAW